MRADRQRSSSLCRTSLRAAASASCRVPIPGLADANLANTHNADADRAYADLADPYNADANRANPGFGHTSFSDANHANAGLTCPDSVAAEPPRQ
jgi:hypothetical protein